MRSSSFLSLFLIIPVFLISSCLVSKKKYDALNGKKSSLEAEKADCQDQLTKSQAEVERLNAQIANLNTQVDTLNSRIEGLGKLNTNLQKEHEKYKDQTKAQTNVLNKNLSQREKDLIESEKKVQQLQVDLQEREARVKELEKVLADKDKAVNELKNKVSKALLSFKDKDLTVTVKNGKVYVSLSEQLLFKSGKTDVDTKGKEALKKLAEVLKDQSDINVMGEGHTDDVKINEGTPGMKDNWDLSVLRATEITRLLIAGGVDPQKVVPAGRGEFQPVAEGKTAEARQKNRRTEIILTPKLDELFKILDN
ncbi:MAG: OmpA family protein [Cytophagaceae bacterium]